jgi:hypothetical protein
MAQKTPGNPSNKRRAMAKPATAKKPAAKGVLSVKITLRNVKPPIWRRVAVRGGMNLGDLHVLIQVVMGWDNGHLHAFDIGGEQYGDPDGMDDIANENRLTLNGLVKSGVSRFRYTYDFGDDWEHDVLIEKASPPAAVTAFPACVAGKRHCPPEDCGGPWGYAELLETLANPAHPDHGEQREWIGEGFDPEEFSVAETDTALAEVFRRTATA